MVAPRLLITATLAVAAAACGAGGVSGPEIGGGEPTAQADSACVQELLADPSERQQLITLVDELPEPSDATAPMEDFDATDLEDVERMADGLDRPVEDMARLTVNSAALNEYVDHTALEADPTFAGLWLTEEARVAIAFTHDVAKRVERLRQTYPRPYDLIGFHATHPLRELHRLKDRVGDHRERFDERGVKISRWGADVKENRMVVGVVSDLEQAAAVICELELGPTEALRIERSARLLPLPLPLDP